VYINKAACPFFLHIQTKDSTLIFLVSLIYINQRALCHPFQISKDGG
jgi:hypothetical protein